MEDAGIKPGKKDSTILAALPYVFGIFVALLIYLIAKEDKFARFHALQAIMLQIAIMPIMLAEFVLALVLLITVIGYIAMIFVIIATGFLTLFLNLYLAYNAYQGNSLMLPKLGEMAKARV